MLMIDGAPENLCTCLLFMNPVPATKPLLALWEKEIIETNVQQDQASLSSISFGVESFRSNRSGHSSTNENKRNAVDGLPDSCQDIL